MIKKLLTFLIGTALLAAGAALLATGYGEKHQLPSWAALVADLPSPELIAMAANAAQSLPAAFQQILDMRESGLYYPFLAAGGILAFIGLVLALSVFRHHEPHEIPVRMGMNEGKMPVELSAHEKTPAHDHADSHAGKGEEEEENSGTLEDNLRNVNFLIMLGQGALKPDMIDAVVKMYRADLLEYFPLLNEASREQLTRKILDSAVLHQQRRKKGITTDQFQAHDARVNSVENAVFARRYMPHPEKITSPEQKEAAGKVFDLTTQASLQHQFHGDARDWADVSLHSALHVLSEPYPPAAG